MKYRRDFATSMPRDHPEKRTTYSICIHVYINVFCRNRNSWMCVQFITNSSNLQNKSRVMSTRKTTYTQKIPQLVFTTTIDTTTTTPHYFRNNFNQSLRATLPSLTTRTSDGRNLAKRTSAGAGSLIWNAEMECKRIPYARNYDGNIVGN